MPEASAQAFARFLGAISPTANQVEDVKAKERVTRQYLTEAFPPTSDIPFARLELIGSAARGTLIRPVNDVDVLAVFTNKGKVFERYRKDSAAFLYRVNRTLGAKCKVETVGARGQAIRLFYKGGAHVDIAPVFRWSSGGFGLPAGDRTWLTTDPGVQAAWYSSRTASLGQGVTALVKLAKRWNVVHSKNLKSFHLEVMVASMFKTVGAHLPTAMSTFFKWAPNWLSVTDPAQHGGQLDRYLSSTARAAVLSRFKEAHDRALASLSYEQSGNFEEALRLWKIELGEGF